MHIDLFRQYFSSFWKISKAKFQYKTFTFFENGHIVFHLTMAILALMMIFTELWKKWEAEEHTIKSNEKEQNGEQMKIF